MRIVPVTATTYLKQAIDNWSLAKLAYSALLLAIIWLFLTELWRLWFDQSVFLGRFEFYENGESKPAQATAFAFLTSYHQKRLRDALVAEQERRTKQGTTWSPPGAEPINISESALGQMEITIQGVNVGAILQKLREWISPPNQITATIEKGAHGVRAAASWPRGPSRARGAKFDAQFFQITEKSDESAAAQALAYQLAWVHSAKTRIEPEVSSQEFCDWAQAWLSYLDLRERNRGIGGLSDADVKSVKDLHAFVTRQIKGGAKFPEFKRLRADLFDLFPASERSADLVAQAQLDSVAYAISVDPEKRKLSQEEAKLATFAQARPAIPVRAGRVQDLPKTWADRLAPRIEHLNAAIRATGWVKILRGSEQVSMCTGFAVGPNLIATASFVLPESSKLPEGKLPEGYSATFSFSDELNPSSASSVLKVEQVLFASSNLEHVALLRVSGHDVKVNQPLRIASDEALPLLDRDVFLVGYPVKASANSPPEFVEALLGADGDIKRIMPGRIANVEEIAGSWAKELNCDFSSGPGSAGGPVVDLETGTVLGLHTSGKWDEQRGNITTAIRLVGFAEKASLPEWLRRELNPAVSIRTILPEGLTLRHALETLAKTNDGTTNFKDPSAAELDELVKGGEMEAATAAALMESFSARFVNQQVRIQLKVVYQPETNVYEITIDR